MRARDPAGRRSSVAAILFAAAIATVAASQAARAGGPCALVPNARDPSEKILHCGQTLTVQPAHGTRYRPIFKPGQPVPTGARLDDDGALLIEFHPSGEDRDFQILTPLAIAAVRGTKWAMEVTGARTSTLVLSGAVAVTSRHLNQYVVLTEGQGVDVSAQDTALTRKTWGEARIRALLARFQ
jgi:FecR protein